MQGLLALLGGQLVVGVDLRVEVAQLTLHFLSSLDFSHPAALESVDIGI